MGVLDSVLIDAGDQLGISSNSAGSVLSGLLSFINQEDGGLGAFLDRFRRIGVGSLVTSWLSGDARTVSPDAVESALGHQTIDRIGSRAGLSFSTAASAIALMLPKVIQRLAPGGAIPRVFSSDVQSYITGSGAAISGEARQALSAAESLAHTGGIRGYLWPILALLFLAALFLIWLSTRGGHAVNTVAFSVAEQVQLASQKATAALESLKPGYTANDLVSALNLGVINFATGSAEIPSDSDALLTKAAAAFPSAPAGTLVEIAGHTDNSGDPSANMQLSQQRADAVRGYLVRQGVNPAMLVARGYGDTKPVASNDTEEGRFRNRRIEFSVK